MSLSFNETSDYIYISTPNVESFYSEIVKSCENVSSEIESPKKSPCENIISVFTEENFCDIIHEIKESNQVRTENRDYDDVDAAINEKSTEVEADENLEGFRCHICSYLLPSSRTLRYHLVKIHAVVNSISYFCPLCEHEFWSEKQLNYHLNLHHGIKRADLACNVCGVELCSRSEVKAHQRKHLLHYRCPSCNQKFGAKHLLLLHIQDHIAKLKPYSCCLCGRRFKHVKAYFLHEWRHSNQICTEHKCRDEFEDESLFLTHLQKVHKMKDHELKNIVSSKDELDRNIDFLLCLSSKKNITKYIDVENCDGENYVLFFFIIETDENSFMHIENWKKLKWKLRSNGELSYINVSRLKEQLEQIVLNYNIKEEKSIFEDEAEVIELENLLHRRQSKHTCGLCNLSFTSFEQYQHHLSSHKKMFKCHSCSRCYRSLKLLRRHYNLHCSKYRTSSPSDECMPIKCPECGKLCSSKKGLHRHKEKHRVSKKYKCKRCQKSFTAKGHLNEHLFVFHKEETKNVTKTFICPVCDKALASKKYFTAHMRLHGDGTQEEGEDFVSLSCPQCEKKFTRPQMLNHHILEHSVEHKCSICSKSFPSQSVLSTHLNSHDQEMKQRLACKDCNLKFSYKCQLRIHMLTHTGEKPFVCEKCGKRFRRLQQCRVHDKLVHSEKQLQCKDCLKFFGTESNLLRHSIAFHLNLKRWICGICGHAYGYSQDLRNHLRKVHHYELKNISYKSKKSNSEVYIIPDLDSQNISFEMRQKIEFIQKEESLKLQTFIHNKEMSNSADQLLTSHAEQFEVAYPAQSLYPPLKVQAILPSVQYHNPHQAVVMENVSESITDINSGLKDGAFINRYNVIDTTKEIACDSSMAFSGAYVPAHYSTAHVLFQCPVCSLKFTSKNACDSHIGNVHSYINELQNNQYVIHPMNTNMPLATIAVQPIGPNPGSFYQLIPLDHGDGSVVRAPACQDHNYVIQLEAATLYQAGPVSSSVLLPDQSISGSAINQPNSITVLQNETVALPIAIMPAVDVANIEEGNVLNVVPQSVYETSTFQNQLSVPESVHLNSDHLSISSNAISKDWMTPSIEAAKSDLAALNVNKNGVQLSHNENTVIIKEASSTAMCLKDTSILTDSLYPHQQYAPDLSVPFPSAEQTPSICTQNDFHLLENKEPNQNKDEGEEEEEEEEENEKEEESTTLDINSTPSDTQGVVDKHVKTSSDSNSSKVFYKCRICDKLYSTLPSLERHNKVHDGKKMECLICGKFFVEKFNLKTHMMTHTKEKPLECQYCNKKFRYCRDLKDHLRAHDGVLPFQCSFCDLKFLRSRDLVRHQREQHEQVKHTCKECGQQFGRKYYLEKYHMKIHKKDLMKKKISFNCVLCSEIFDSEHFLSSHKCSSEASFKCTKCDRSFHKKRSLSAHLRIHNGEEFCEKDNG